MLWMVKATKIKELKYITTLYTSLCICMQSMWIHTCICIELVQSREFTGRAINHPNNWGFTCAPRTFRLPPQNRIHACIIQRGRNKVSKRKRVTVRLYSCTLHKITNDPQTRVVVYVKNIILFFLCFQFSLQFFFFFSVIFKTSFTRIIFARTKGWRASQNHDN